MPNMSYCRFENTMRDLRDCLDHIHKQCDNTYDESSRQEMIEMFNEISQDFDGNVVEYARNYA